MDEGQEKDAIDHMIGHLDGFFIFFGVAAMLVSAGFAIAMRIGIASHPIYEVPAGMFLLGMLSFILGYLHFKWRVRKINNSTK